MKNFTHLHCHSHFSLLDGASSITKLAQAAKDRGMNSLAITDHGNLHGALQFYKECHKVGINPIIGYEAYVAPGFRGDREARCVAYSDDYDESGKLKEKNKSSYHLTLLAQNRTGFRNICKMASLASREGFYYKPRIDLELLEEYSDGVICLSGCVAGQMSQYLLTGMSQEARNLMIWYRRTFGDRFFAEVQNNNLQIQTDAAELTIDMANSVGVPIVATSDCHYVSSTDVRMHDTLICIASGAKRQQKDRFKFTGDQFHLRTPQEMYEAFPNNPEYVQASQEIADTVDIQLDLGKRYFPVFDIPKVGYTEDEFLRKLCTEALEERYDEITDEVSARLERELDVIAKLGFSSYFLICWDFVKYARDNGIQATARGSGVGSIVAYLLYLSNVCPIEYGLLFERFLDPNRAEAPDIDIDFERDRREEVIDYVKQKYGEESVAQIVTFGTLGARAAIRDVCRVEEFSYKMAQKIVSLIPDKPKVKIIDAITEVAELTALYTNDPAVKDILDLAMQVEGLARNMGKHAAALVIAPGPIDDYVPVIKASKSKDIITQWAMDDVESAGLLKMDFLGLRNLDILSNTIKTIEEESGHTIDPYEFPLDDQDTYDLLARGETKGIFQLESDGIRDLLVRMKPDCFNDIIATAALYRPGPIEGGMVDEYVEVKNGRKAAHYEHEIMEEVLEETHGVMVYQEQVMLILHKLGGIELRESYKCIKAISKKKEDVIDAFRQQFYEGCQGKVSQKFAEDTFERITFFAAYGFNKSHSTAYAKIAYMTAYLKCHYPVQFMCSLLASNSDKRNFSSKDSIADHIDDCQRMGIPILPPDLNRSGLVFTVSEGSILFGLSAIRNCGAKVMQSLITERKSNGGYKDLTDLFLRCRTACKSNTLKALNASGALGMFGNFSQVDNWIETQKPELAKNTKKANAHKLLMSDPERLPEVLPPAADWEAMEALQREKDAIGYYLTGHPIDICDKAIRERANRSCRDLLDSNRHPMRDVTMVGLISEVTNRNLKSKAGNKGGAYKSFQLEDGNFSIQCFLWPDANQMFGHLIRRDSIVVLEGYSGKRDGQEAVLHVTRVTDGSDVLKNKQGLLKLRVPAKDAEAMECVIEDLKRILRNNRGTCPVEIAIPIGTTTVLIRPKDTLVKFTGDVRNQIEDVIGREFSFTQED